MPDFSDYIVYVDESGDHGLKNINQSYPMFCLAFCIFEKADYIQRVVPAFQQLKFDYWGHDAVILHEHEIRKARDGDFAFLANEDSRNQFLEDVGTLIQKSDFKIITEIWRKSSLPKNMKVYDLSLEVCMVELLRWLPSKGQKSGIVHLIFESRGQKEDNELELVFRRVCSGTTKFTAAFATTNLMFELRFVKKSANSTGLQIADLVARPIGLNYLRPEQPNRAFDTIKEKMITKMWSQRIKDDFF